MNFVIRRYPLEKKEYWKDVCNDNLKNSEPGTTRDSRKIGGSERISEI